MHSDRDMADLQRKVASAIDRLAREGFRARQMDMHHVKIGEVNFYPSTGTITIDGIGRYKEGKGLDALIPLLLER